MDDLSLRRTRNKRGDWTPGAYLDHRARLRPSASAAGFSEMASRLFPAVEPSLRGICGRLCLFRASRTSTSRGRWPGAGSSRLFIVNCIAVFLFCSAFEYRLYAARAQGSRFKYHAKFPNDQKNTAFLFRSQNLEGIIRGFGTGVPIWTAYEVGILFAFANGYAPWLAFSQHTLYLGLLALLVPMFHEFHFFCIHRLIHWPPLHRSVHSVHHHSVNPRPGHRCRCIRSSSCFISHRR